MKAKKVKCYFIVSKIEHDDIEVESNDCEKLLGINIDSKLNSKGHLDKFIKKVTQKVNALSRISPYLNIKYC